MRLSAPAAALLRGLVEAYANRPPENHRAWMFDKGAEDEVHSELLRFRIIERQGSRGSYWHLTDFGLDCVHKLMKPPDTSLPIAQTTLAEKQRDRFQLLKVLYELTDGDTSLDVVDEELEKVSALSTRAFQKAESYLDDEGLINGATLRSISLTHAGVIEYESTLAALDGQGKGSTYFPSDVVRPVINQYFHGAVGAVQTGTSSVAHVHQSIGIGATELQNILSQFLGEISSDAPHSDAAKALVAVAQEELASTTPNWDRVKSAVVPLTKFVATSATPLLVAYVKAHFGL